MWTIAIDPLNFFLSFINFLKENNYFNYSTHVSTIITINSLSLSLVSPPFF